jgi:hypothetical protein
MTGMDQPYTIILIMLEKEVTFIVQGPTCGKKEEKFAQYSCESIRSFFPQSRIILSTWVGQNLQNIDYDKLVLSQDPGAEVVIDSSQTLNNVNRQIVSTFAGISSSETKYSIKIRSDLIFINNNLLSILDKRPVKKSKFSEDFLDEYVVVSNVTTINPSVSLVLPHHPCDWIYAGLTTDLYQIWDIDLMPKSWFRYYSNNPWPKDVWHEKNYLSLFRPESYIWSSFLKKYKKINFMSSFDSSPINLANSNKIIALNLMVQTNKSIGIKSLKNRITNITLIPSYTEKEWSKLALSFGRNAIISSPKYEHFIITILRKFRMPLSFYISAKSNAFHYIRIAQKKILRDNNEKP